MERDNNKLPLYWKLAEIIEEKIEKGDWKKGDKIPSERELCKLYGMSRITVRNAINELVVKEKLEKIQGKGTFVLGKSIHQKLKNVYSFSKEMEKQGKISSTVLLMQKEMKANSKIARELRIAESDPVIYIERLRCADDYPVMLEKTYFSKIKYDFVMNIDLNTKPLYRTLEDEYGLTINKAIETFKAVELKPDEKKLLGAEKRSFGLFIKRTSYQDGQIVSFSTIVSRGDVFEFTVTLE